jgi:hypothetical protein
VYDKFAHQTFFSFGEDKDEVKKMRICHPPYFFFSIFQDNSAITYTEVNQLLADGILTTSLDFFGKLPFDRLRVTKMKR